MDLIVGVRGHLLGLQAIEDLVVDRVHTPVLPAKCLYPAIQLQWISPLIGGMHLRGPDGLFKDRVQLNAWDVTRDSAVALGLLCRRRMNGFAGVWSESGSPGDSLRVQLAKYEEGSAQFVEEIHHGLCAFRADFLITYSDSSQTMLTSA